MVTIPARFTPTAVIRQNAKTTSTSPITTSARICGTATSAERRAEGERHGDTRGTDGKDRQCALAQDSAERTLARRGTEAIDQDEAREPGEP